MATPGGVLRATTPFADGAVASVCLRVAALLPPVRGRAKSTLTDGVATVIGIFEADADTASLGVGALLELTAYSVLPTPAGPALLIKAFSLSAGGASEPPAAAQGTPPSAPKPASHAFAPPKPPSPGVTTPGLPPRPPAALGARRVTPIEALNPYSGGWTLRVRAAAKSALKSVKTAKGDTKVFDVELSDEQGSTIRATAWRETADALHASFVDGKTYYVSGGMLKPAGSKGYNPTGCPYEMTLTERSVVEPAADSAMAAPALRFAFSPIDGLAAKVGATADVLALVTQVGDLGSVARKSDGASLAKREITLLDATAHTVRLTLWTELAEGVGGELAGAVAAWAEAGGAPAGVAPPVVACKSLRVSDFNGCSLSTVGRSAIVMQPQPGDASSSAADGCAQTAAAALRAWYTAGGGATAATTEAGAGLAAAGLGGGKGGAGGPTKRLTFEDVQPASLPPADAKPEWALVSAFVLHIQADGTHYYPSCPDAACPGFKKKVVADGAAGWLCEAGSRTHAACARRYILRFKAGDASGGGWVNTFDEESKLILGCSADELHAMKEDGSGRYGAKLKAACMRPWLMKLKTKTDAYNGEERRRITAVGVAKMNYGEECKLLLAALGAAPVAA